MTNFTDAERRFSDSPAGLAIIAKARREFEIRNAYMGDQAPQWTDAHSAGVVRQACRDTARSAVTGAAAMASAQRHEPTALATRDTAREMRKAYLSNAHLGEAWRQD